MNYYEELGLSPATGAEEIRQAYLNLARILHPDQQQDETLRRLADAQMKRLNRVYEVLSDPERRRHYDSELQRESAERQAPIIVAPPVPPRSKNIATLVWLASAILGIAGISWYINRESAQPLSTQGPTVTEAKEQRPSRLRPDEPRRMPVAAETRLEAQGESGRQAEMLAELINLRLQLKAASAERDRMVQQLANQSLQTNELSRLLKEERAKTQSPDKAFVSSAPPARPASKPVGADRFAGNWMYLKPKFPSARSSLHVPAFIEAVIVEEDGVLRGRYRARYEVSDKAISPDVSFYFEGKPQGSNANLRWNGEGGSKGDVQLTLTSENSLHVGWSATEMGKYLGLSSGTAVLVRRPEP